MDLNFVLFPAPKKAQDCLHIRDTLVWIPVADYRDKNFHLKLSSKMKQYFSNENSEQPVSSTIASKISTRLTKGSASSKDNSVERPDIPISENKRAFIKLDRTIAGQTPGPKTLLCPIEINLGGWTSQPPVRVMHTRNNDLKKSFMTLFPGQSRPCTAVLKPGDKEENGEISRGRIVIRPSAHKKSIAGHTERATANPVQGIRTYVNIRKSLDNSHEFDRICLSTDKKRQLSAGNSYRQKDTSRNNVKIYKRIGSRSEASIDPDLGSASISNTFTAAQDERPCVVVPESIPPVLKQIKMITTAISTSITPVNKPQPIQQPSLIPVCDPLQIDTDEVEDELRPGDIAIKDITDGPIQIPSQMGVKPKLPSSLCRHNGSLRTPGSLLSYSKSIIKRPKNYLQLQQLIYDKNGRPKGVGVSSQDKLLQLDSALNEGHSVSSRGANLKTNSVDSASTNTHWIPCLFFESDSTEHIMMHMTTKCTRQDILLIYLHGNGEDISEAFHMCRLFRHGFNVP